MTVESRIKEYIAGQPEPKRGDMQELHRLILAAMPGCELRFLDGKDDKGKVVSNPNIGYGEIALETAGGKSRPFYQVGLSANSAGLSVYIMGIKDRTYLPRTIGKKIGKAGVTGYCIKFKALKDINPEVLVAAIRDVIEAKP